MDVTSGPDHVRVISDEQGFICEGGLLRAIKVEVVDVNNRDVTWFPAIRSHNSFEEENDNIHSFLTSALSG